MDSAFWGELVKAAECGDGNRVLALTADLSEATRAEYAPDGERIAGRLTTGSADGYPPPEFRRAQAAAAAVVLLCFAAPGDYRFAIRDAGTEWALLAIRQRSRMWRDRWVSDYLAHGFIDWLLVRALRRDDAFTDPGESYSWAIGRHVGYGEPAHTYERDVYAELLSDPDLLDDDVYRVFEVERLAATWHGLPDYWNDWSEALLRLEREGRVSRRRLLDASLAGVGSQRLITTVKALAVFHGKLRPTIAELDERQVAYLGLLESGAKPAVALGLRSLERLARARRLDGPAFIDGLPTALPSLPRDTARRLVQLAHGIVAADPTLATGAVTPMSAALAHPAGEVQNAAVALLEDQGRPLDPDTQFQLSEMLGQLDPMVRRRAARLCGLGDDVNSRPASAVVIPDPEPLDPWEIRRLRTATAIVPIADLDELLAETAVVLESQDDPERLERWCDGVARLCDLAVDETRSRPLIRRASRRRGDFVRQTAEHAVATIVYHWLTSDPLHKISGIWSDGYGRHSLQINAGPHAALNRRLVVVAERAASASARPLLSAPTHRGGWIDPLVLADRLTNSVAIDDEDLAEALLRVPPGRHESARAQIGTRGQEALRALRAALGDRSSVAPDPPTLPATWDSVAFLRGERAWMETPLPGPGPWAHGTPLPEKLITADVSPVRTLTIAAPVTSFPGDFATRRWLALISPGDLAPYFSYSLAHYRLQDQHVYWMTRTEAETIGPGLEPMLVPDTSLGPSAYELLAVALGATTSDRLLAAEVVVEAIIDRRLAPHALGTAIATAMRRPGAVPDRWASALEAVPRVSALHAYETQRVLESILGALEGEQLALTRLAELLREIVVDGDARIQDDGARTWLHAVPPRSKRGRAAADALAVSGDGAVRSVAAAQCVAEYEERRALRWEVATSSRIGGTRA